MSAQWMTETPSFVLFYLAAALVAITRGRWRASIAIGLPLLSAWLLYCTPHGEYWSISLFDLQLSVYRVDKLSVMFGWIFHIAALLGIIYSLHVKDTVQQVAALVYSGSALGAAFAGDLLTLFVFWELLALSSVWLIWARRTDRAFRAGMRYLLFQLVSGLLLLVGALVHQRAEGSLHFDFIGLQGAGGYLLFLAFGIKCAFPFAHTWLTDAYPEATPTGTVLLSAFTTKVAVYALARGFPGTEALVYIGAAMTCFPIFYAVIENDLRRVLAYSLINQVGFMVCGIGIGTAMAMNGAIAHAFNDVIFKGLLFMSMGAVLQMTGRINGSELGGLYKTMPKTTILCIVGAASISAFPLFSGFVSKSMVMTAAIANGYEWIWLMLLFASAGVFHHAGIKIPYFAFFAHDSGLRASDPPGNMLLAMTIAAFLCIAIGVFPQALYQLLPFVADYQPYDLTHVLTQLQLLFFSALAFVWLNLRGLYPPELPSINLDIDWFYRRWIPQLLAGWMKRCSTLMASARAVASNQLNNSLLFLQRHEPDAIFNRTNLSGSMVLWVAIILAWFLLVSLLSNSAS